MNKIYFLNNQAQDFEMVDMIAGYLLSIGRRPVVVLLVWRESVAWRELLLGAWWLVAGQAGGGKSSLAYSDPCLAVVAGG